MTILHSVMLGVLQGLTEFLPISSSGHLALAQRLLPGFSQPGVTFDVALHLGTAVSVLAMEFDRIVEALKGGFALRLLAQLMAATLATAAVAFPLRHTAEAAFSQPLLVACGLAASGVLLLLMPRGPAGRSAADTAWRDVLFVGLVQGVAVMPGLSRSGSTIVAGAAAGMERRWAADFSFLLSVPAVLGAAVVEAHEYRQTLAVSPGFLPLAGVGFGAAALSGMGAIALVRRFLRAGQLRWFAAYLLPLATVVMVTAALGWW